MNNYLLGIGGEKLGGIDGVEQDFVDFEDSAGTDIDHRQH